MCGRPGQRTVVCAAVSTTCPAESFRSCSYVHVNMCAGGRSVRSLRCGGVAGARVQCCVGRCAVDPRPERDRAFDLFA